MKNQYTPRRASKRWLANAPAHVLDLFHDKKRGSWEALYTGPLLLTTYPHNPRTFANTIITGREMDTDPFHPQGVGIYFELSAYDATAYRYRNGKRRVTWDSLPEKVKRCIIQDGQA